MDSKVIRSAIFLFFLISNSVLSELLQAHVVFRHGEKTTEVSFTYPTDPYKNYSFEPYGPAQITNEGKRSCYSLGQKLRERYDAFLGDLYLPNLVESWSSNYQRCQTSLLVVLASLFPPKDPLMWNENLNWQPIPYQYLPKERDNLFTSLVMTDFIEEYYRYYYTEGYKKLPKEALPTFSYVQTHSNSTIKTLRDLLFFYFIISSEENYGLTLPEWTKEVYPQPISDLILLEYSFHTATRILKRKSIGRLLRKVLADSENRITNSSSYKLHLYSGHDITIVWILMFLGLMYDHHPGFSACLILEVHKENQGHFMEVHYRDDKHSKFELLRFHNGERRLYFHHFRDMVLDLFKEDAIASRSPRKSTTCLNVTIVIIFYYCLTYSCFSYTKL